PLQVMRTGEPCNLLDAIGPEGSLLYWDDGFWSPLLCFVKPFCVFPITHPAAQRLGEAPSQGHRSPIQPGFRNRGKGLPRAHKDRAPESKSMEPIGLGIVVEDRCKAGEAEPGKLFRRLRR